MSQKQAIVTSLLLSVGAGCKHGSTEQATGGGLAETTTEVATSPPRIEESRAFAGQVKIDLRKLWGDWARTEWIKITYIIYDTELNHAHFHEKVLEYTAAKITASTQFDGLELDADTRRTLGLLKVSQSLTAPNDPNVRRRLAEMSARMESIYGRSKRRIDNFAGKSSVVRPAEEKPTMKI